MKKFVAGTPTQRDGYKSFTPSPVNHEFDWEDREIPILYGDAMRLLGELNGYADLVPDADFFIRMHVVREVNKSSMIEGGGEGGGLMK